VEEILPQHVSTLPIDRIYKHLKKYHGIPTHVASIRLHKIKDENNLPADFDLLFDRTGKVCRADERTHIDSLTSGGKTGGEK
jgi:hypothetical protein